MNRHANWQERLSDLIRARTGKEFAWGAGDCTQFAFDAIKAVTDQDPLAEVRTRYKTAAGAVKTLRKLGAQTCEELIARYCGERKTIAFARKGDVVVVDNPEAIGLDVEHGAEAFGPIIGVCYGQFSYFTAPYGLVRVETLRCDGCYHVLIRGDG